MVVSSLSPALQYYLALLRTKQRLVNEGNHQDASMIADEAYRRYRSLGEADRIALSHYAESLTPRDYPEVKGTVDEEC